jgi:hypothetical protein
MRTVCRQVALCSQKVIGLYNEQCADYLEFMTLDGTNCEKLALPKTATRLCNTSSGSVFIQAIDKDIYEGRMTIVQPHLLD